jgi:hypothetical protein
MRSKTTSGKLDSLKQREWLRQHIPHRICAASTWLTMKGDWVMPPDPEWKDKRKNSFHIWCIGRSVDEGRKAALRWLIEFVGIHSDYRDISIKDFNQGKLFDTAARDAKKLEDVWLGCSKASLHPTFETMHPLTDREQLAEVLQIIVEHLEKHLYAPNGFKLLKIVRDQEERTHSIWR